MAQEITTITQDMSKAAKQRLRQANHYAENRVTIRAKQNARNRADPEYNTRMRKVYCAQPQKDKQKIRNRANRLVKEQTDGKNWRELLFPIRSQLIEERILIDPTDELSRKAFMATINRRIKDEIERLK